MNYSDFLNIDCLQCQYVEEKYIYDNVSLSSNDSNHSHTSGRHKNIYEDEVSRHIHYKYWNTSEAENVNQHQEPLRWDKDFCNLSSSTIYSSHIDSPLFYTKPNLGDFSK